MKVALIVAEAMSGLLMTGDGCAPIEIISTFESDSVVLAAPIVTEKVPNTVGVPEMNPVCGLTAVPTGRPLAEKLVGLLLATI